MEDKNETRLDSASSKVSALCEECKENKSKYTCPGCSIRSCSLPCVKSHKQRTGCNGKRNKTQFVPLSQFDDNILISDYNLLEEVKRVAESAQRRRTNLCGNFYPSLPYDLKRLQGAARSRGTKLMFLSKGMSKRAKNQTQYDNRKKVISWTIEWRFQSTDVILVDHGVHEDTNLCSVIENHLKPSPWNHKLKKFSDLPLDSLKLFIRVYPKGSKSPYRELDIKTSLRQQLANIILLEYPVIHIFLPSHNINFEVIKDKKSVGIQSTNSTNSNHQIHEGVTFKEEEIEEDITESLEPQVLDLGDKGSRPLSSDLKEPKLSENMDFDFDPGLMDAYSDLMGGINTNDFLNFGGEFPEDFKTVNLAYLDVAIDEELEEGEIGE